MTQSSTAAELQFAMVKGIARPFQWRFTTTDLAASLTHFDHTPAPNRMPAQRSNRVSSGGSSHLREGFAG